MAYQLLSWLAFASTSLDFVLAIVVFVVVARYSYSCIADKRLCLEHLFLHMLRQQNCLLGEHRQNPDHIFAPSSNTLADFGFATSAANS